MAGWLTFQVVIISDAFAYAMNLTISQPANKIISEKKRRAKINLNF
jgi:hypothetical protein